jgi:2-amino-4-hydroxy-6-hydroxymethyldihydropteridine diphosphokinase/dihydropteroate synthase
MKEYKNTTFVVMHSVTIPVEKGAFIDDKVDIIQYLTRWVVSFLDKMARHGIENDGRIIFDPGLGFGKTARHCFDIVNNIQLLKKITQMPLLIGHSRKTFLNPAVPPQERDLETVLLSMTMLDADYIRVHDVANHVRAFNLMQTIKTC